MARRPGLNHFDLETVEYRVQKERRHQRDLYAPLSDIRLDVASPEPVEGPERFRLAVVEGARERKLKVTTTALRQICSIAGVPTNFIDTIPASVATKLIRCLLQIADHSYGKRYLLRVKGGRTQTLRAILPHNYVRFDDHQLIGELRNAATEDGLTVARLAIDDDSLFLRILLPRKVNLGGFGHHDPGHTGIDIISSETGVLPLQIKQVVFRVVCSNGLTTESEAAKLLHARHTRVDRSTFREAVQNALTEALENGRHSAERLAGLRGRYIDDPHEEIDRIFRTYRLGSPRGRIGRWIAQEVLREVTLFGVQKWDICQAFTAVARGLDHRDRMKLEDAMGAYIMEGTAKAS
jgi:hypothetical protein